MRFPFYKQLDKMDCGPTCIRMIAKHYKRSMSAEYIRNLAEVTRQGSNLKTLSTAAEKIGFRTLGVKISLERLIEEAPLPCIVHWKQEHFVVVYKIKNGTIHVADPGTGLLKIPQKEFLEAWIGPQATAQTEEGIVLLFEPTPRLYEIESQDEFETPKQRGFSFLFSYLFRYRSFLIQLIVGLIAGSIIQLAFPFLTQSVVDIGVQQQDIHFVYLILMAQLFLFFGRMSLEVIQGWILLHLSTRISISLISDFFIKLMNLPISFFDTKMTGDIMQRIADHNRIESLLTTTSLSVIFSMTNLLIFSAVLAWYNMKICLLFILGSAFYFVWIMIFLKKRKKLDYDKFNELSKEQSKVIELINGMQEIKMHNAEKRMRWSWEFIRTRLFRVQMRTLALQQTQSVGSNFINEVKNIVITVLSASLVIQGEITLGMMLAIAYIIGQLNAPIQQLVGLVHKIQDARIAMERLSEIHNRADEEGLNSNKISQLPEAFDIEVSDLHFKYPGTNEAVLQGINMIIPHNKTTAIVGASGSGKTTLMKVLLKFYEPDSGSVSAGHHSLNNVSARYWRDLCGVVMQEGYIFNASIANNIALGDESIDEERLSTAAHLANIQSFIEQQPLGYNTKIGMEGVGMSTGQKQRILIARAIYKNPDIICFDEATSALDAKNERVIMENLDAFMADRTAIVIAHRLSTVKNADQIIVLDGGKIIERGTHEELVALKGSYFTLVKNQLDLERLSDQNNENDG